MHRPQAEFRRRVGKVAAVNGVIGNRSNRNDVTALAKLHVAEECADEQKRRHQIDVQRFDECVGRRFFGDGDAEDTGVVDEYVRRAFQL